MKYLLLDIQQPTINQSLLHRSRFEAKFTYLIKQSYQTDKEVKQQCYLVRFSIMGINTTLNNISATGISWLSVLLVEETRVPRENHSPATNHLQTLSHNVVSSAPRNEQH